MKNSEELKNENNPAFPFIIKTGETLAIGTGVTKREMFAAMAMQGWLASFGPDAGANYQGVAEFSVKQADALLAELAKEKKE